jgi:hypothetical protein
MRTNHDTTLELVVTGVVPLRRVGTDARSHRPHATHSYYLILEAPRVPRHTRRRQTERSMGAMSAKEEMRSTSDTSWPALVVMLHGDDHHMHHCGV